MPTTTQKKPNLARRERLNPDWPIRVMSFPATVLGQVPQEVWDNARLMNQLWNDLVALFEQTAAKDLKDENKQSLLTKKQRQGLWFPLGQRKTTRTEKNADRYDQAVEMWGNVPSLEQFSAPYKGLLPSTYYEAVLSRFLVTVKEWLKAAAIKGPPQRKFGLQKINLPVVFNEGTTLQHLMSGRKASLRYTEHMKTEGGKAYLNNAHVCVGVNNVPVPLHVAFSRPLEAQAYRPNHAKKAVPAEHRIKRVSLVGDYKQYRKWQWKLQVQIEHPPIHQHRQLTGRQCGLDVGWRMREDGLRIGCLVDTEGRILEIVLPFQMLNRDERRNLKRFGTTGKVNDWRNLAGMQAQADAAKDQCKASLKEIAQREVWTGEAAATMRGFDKLGRRGLRKLLDVLPPESAAVAVVQEWLAVDSGLQRQLHGTEEVLQRTWDDLRKKIAAWLAREYDVIAIEKLDLKGMAEAWVSANEGGLDAARKWRQRASLHSFLQWVQLQAKKQQATVEKKPAAYTTTTCSECGGVVEKDKGKLVLVCENGHQQDQDVNAARNLCADLEASSIPQKLFEIPAELRQYVRVVSVTD